MNFSSSSEDDETAYDPPIYPELTCSPWTRERSENRSKHDLHIEKYLKKSGSAMGWRQVYQFMEKMGVGQEHERVKPKKIDSPPHHRNKIEKSTLDESGLESSQFVLNQLRRVLGNRKPKRNKRRKKDKSKEEY